MKTLRRSAKFAFLVFIGLILYGVATSSGAGWLYVVSASIAGIILVSILSALWNTRSIEVTRAAPLLGTAGEPFTYSVKLHNRGHLPRYMLEVEDRFAGGTGRGVAVRVKRGEIARVECTIENPRRGVYSGGGIRIESSAPFGFLWGHRRLRIQNSSPTVVHPRIFFIAGLPVPTSREAADSEKDDANVPQRGLGGEFWGVREYRPGDPARLIAWRQSARVIHTDHLAVMEMSRETTPPLTIALDLDPRAPSDAREMGISAAASLLLHALREGREVSVDAGAQLSSFPQQPDAYSILDWCAGLESSRPPGMEDASVEILPSIRRKKDGGSRAGTVVLVSCHEFEGAGPWMTPEEENEFLDGIEAEGRRAVRLGPDVTEPWRIT